MHASDPHRLEAARRRVSRIADWLDGLFTIPGTRIRIGLDALLGLIPGVGDFAGLLLGTTIIVESLRIGAPRGLIARMLANVAVDTVGGAVPGIGDLFDVAFRSHARNARLLLEHLDARGAGQAVAQSHGRGLALLVLAVLFGLLGLVIFGLYTLGRALFG